jgi:hypothetical protein
LPACTVSVPWPAASITASPSLSTTNVLLPAPPDMVSLPASPFRVSLPPRPLSVSFSLVPVRELAILVPFVTTHLYRQQVADLHSALNEPEARTEAASILRGLVERVSVGQDGEGHVVTLTGAIVKLLTLPGGDVPASFESSVKVVAGARFDRDLKCRC